MSGAGAGEGPQGGELRSEVLTRFTEAHRGARVLVEVQEAGGERRGLAPESQVELRLVGVTQEEREGQASIRVVVHEHPGAKLEAVELERPTNVVERDGSLSIEGEDGARMTVDVIAPAASPA